MTRKRQIKSYRDLDVWQRGMDLLELIYGGTASFAREERYVMVSQLRRAGLSVPSNIAEGWGRRSPKDYTHFLNMARTSLYEIETQWIAAHRFGYISTEKLDELLEATDVLSRMLLSLMRSVYPRRE